MTSRDPFFDKPYESSNSEGPAAWERADKVAPAPAANRLSPNIRPKRKVAALLGGVKA